MNKFKGYLVGRMDVLIEFQMCREEKEENGLFLKISLAGLQSTNRGCWKRYGLTY